MLLERETKVCEVFKIMEKASTDVILKLREGCLQLYSCYIVCSPVPKCLSRGLVWQVYPLHDNISLGQLQRSWVKQVFGLQPLGQSSEQFTRQYIFCHTSLIWQFLFLSDQYQLELLNVSSTQQYYSFAVFEGNQ